MNKIYQKLLFVLFLFSTNLYAVPILTVSGATNFPDVVIGSSSSVQNISLINTGSTALTISNISHSASNIFPDTTSGPPPQPSHWCGFGSDANANANPLLGTPIVLNPGASCNLNLIFVPQVIGTNTASVVISSDAAASPSVINLTGNGLNGAAIGLNTTSLNFGNQAISTSSPPQDIIITNIGNQNEIISPLLVSPGFQRIIIADHTGINDCGNMITPLSSCKISMIFNPLQVGVFSGFVYFTTSDGTSYKTNLIGEAIEKMALINVDNSVNFGNVYVGDTKQQELLIKNTGNDLLLISDLQINDQNYSLENSCSEIKPDNSCILKINYSPKSETLNLAWLIIYSNSSGVSTVSRVELIGRGTKAPAPQIEVDKTIINFGEVLTIFSKNESINIYNRGNKDLLINNIAFDFNNFYNLEHNCQTIKPQESCRITVLFSPVIWGSHHNKIIISSNAGDKEVVLNGRGCRVFSLVNSRYYNLCGN